MTPRFALAFALCLLASPAFAQLAPDAALKSLQPASGLQVSLFASEPMFVNPTSIDVDAAGRVWVCEAVNYRRKLRGQPPLRAEGDRIVVLTDTNGDGTADEAKTFYQAPEIMSPLGVCVLPDASGPGMTVLACQSPDILSFRDADGDLKADGPPKKLLTGFGGLDHDHGVHGLLAGPDGKLYFTVGDAGVSNLQAADGKGPKFSSNSTDCRAGTVWRCNRDGTDLELIAHNFRNNYEPAVDSLGGVFLSDNDDDGNQQTRICYVMPGGNYGYHPRGPGQTHWHEEQPGVVHKILRTYFGSPTGMCFYEGDLLKAYKGQPLHCDAGPRHVRCYRLKGKGAGYDAEPEVLLQSADNWFRPSDVCVGPDGSVFVADWYDPGVGGHGMGDTTRGRVYRLTPTGHAGYRVPTLDLSTNDGILAALASPNLSARSAAQAALKARGLERAAPVINLATKTGDPTTVARGQWMQPQLTGRGTWVSAAVSIASHGASDDAKLMGVRMLDAFTPPGQTLELPLDRLNLGDAPPAVKREWLALARKLSPEQARQLFDLLAGGYDGEDHFYLASLNVAAGTDPKRRETVLADFGTLFRTWNDSVAKLTFELRPAGVLPTLEKSLSDPNLSAKQRAQVIAILAGSDDPRAAKTLLAQLKAGESLDAAGRAAFDQLATFLPGKWAAARESDEIKQAIDRLMNAPGTMADGFALVGAAGRRDFLKKAADAARDTAGATRQAAIKALGKIPTDEAVDALKLLAATPQTAADALQALAAQVPMYGETPAGRRASEALKAMVGDSKTADSLRTAAAEALTASNAGSQWLLGQKDKLSDSLKADAGRLLRNSPFQGVRNAAMMAFPAPGKLDPKKLPPIAELARRRGLAENGRKIFEASVKSEVQCLKCHMVGGVGGQIGPDLSMIGKKASRENLIESILMPSKAIADQFVQHAVETSDDQQIAGLLVGETETDLTIRDANGRDTRVALKDVEARRKLPTSIMPEDLVRTLTVEELLDLVEYMLTLKTSSLTFDSYLAVGPFPAPDDGALDKPYIDESATEFDRNARLPGKGTAVRWTPIRAAQGGYIDLQARYAPDSNNVLTYLLREVESPVDQDVTFSIGSDDGSKLFVNGKQVYESRAHLAASPGMATVTVRLKKGRNTILAKVINGDGGHGWYLTLLAENELKAW